MNSNQLFSYSKINRGFEDMAARDEEFLRLAESNDMLILSRVRNWTDEQLLDRLKSFYIAVDHEKMSVWVHQHPSVQSLAIQLIRENYESLDEKRHLEHVWFCLAVLWERWFPDILNLEMLDERIEDGRRAESTTECCDIWLNIWTDVRKLMAQQNIPTLTALDECEGPIAVRAWVSELSSELHDAGCDDEEYLHKRIALAEETLSLCEDNDKDTTEEYAIDISESYIKLGQHEKAVARLKAYLEVDPNSSWCWSALADCYCDPNEPTFNIEEGLRIFKQAIALPKLRGKDMLFKDMIFICKEFDLKEEAEEAEKKQKRFLELQNLRNEILTASDLKQDAVEREDYLEPEDLEEEEEEEEEDKPLPAKNLPTQRKVGRNDPCLCGSGKKYKKCCGG